MIITKQMIKTNQILSVGCDCDFCCKNSSKTLNESAAITEAICQMCHTK